MHNAYPYINHKSYRPAHSLPFDGKMRTQFMSDLCEKNYAYSFDDLYIERFENNKKWMFINIYVYRKQNLPNKA